MRRHGQGELVPFDPKPERITNRLHIEQREAQVIHQATIQNREENQGHE